MTTTQIFYLMVNPDGHLEDPSTEVGQNWAKSLGTIQAAPGFRRLYWGRRLEEPEKVQLHTVWSTFWDAAEFQKSREYETQVLHCWSKVTGSPSADGMTVRRTTLQHQALEDPFGESLLGYPVGTAIYKGTDAAWHEGAWPLWTHVVRHVDGCRGIAGGSIEEAVEGEEKSYLVYVAWASVKHHEDYHHTEHFRKHFIILNIGHKGYTEYGHVIFKEIREAKVNGNKLFDMPHGTTPAYSANEKRRKSAKRAGDMSDITSIRDLLASDLKVKKQAGKMPLLKSLDTDMKKGLQDWIKDFKDAPKWQAVDASIK